MALQGRLVRIRGLDAPLKPNDETRRKHGAPPLDLNGECGHCLHWDAAEGVYAVQTFGGAVAGVPSANLEALSHEDIEGLGIDAVWPAAVSGATWPFAELVADGLCAKGYCVVQAFTTDVLRESAAEEVADKPGFDEARAETEVAYLGEGNTTRCALLEVDELGRPPKDALAYLDRQLTELASFLAPFAAERLGFAAGERSAAIVRTAADGEEPAKHSELQDADLNDFYMEKFLSWAMCRKVCMLYAVRCGGGALELLPKEGSGGQNKVTLQLRQGRMYLFRHDLFSYAYRPAGESLALQAWLQEESQVFEFREVDRAPVADVEDAVHVVSVHELFPAGCDNCEMTFRAFLGGTDALTGVPICRFDEDLYLMAGDPLAPAYGKAYTMHGALIDNHRLVSFDNEFFGIPHEEAMAMAPSQRWVLETGYTTLYNGGLTKKDLAGKRVGTFLGDSGSEWNGFAVGVVFGVYQKRDQYQASCNTCYTTISRLAHCLSLRGPCLTVDTACSASLVAANSAMHFMRRRVMREGEANRVQERGAESLNHAMCGGILAMVHPGGWIGECSAKMLSLSGRCFTWDASADGFIRGEGCCCAYLRSRETPEVEEVQRHLATVLGTAVAANGRGASLTAPSGPAMSMAMAKSMREGGIQAAEVAIGECHGTATPLGDPIEIGAGRTLMKDKRSRGPFLHTTAKAHVGHEEANAGACALIKAVLMANASVSTPNPGLIAINPNIETAGYPVLFTNELTCTMVGDTIVGVSSFGFGGSIAVANVWADAELGAFKDGQRVLLDKEEALQWIDRVVKQAEPAGLYAGHKHGH